MLDNKATGSYNGNLKWSIWMSTFDLGMWENRKGTKMFRTLQAQLERDRVVIKRGTPSMPKLAFMNGTKWGQIVGDDEPESRAA